MLWKQFKIKVYMFYMTSTRETLSVCSSSLNNCSSSQRRFFFTALISVRRKGLITAIQRENNFGYIPFMVIRHPIGQKFMQERISYELRGTTANYKAISCWNRAIPLLKSGIELNWCIWAERRTKNGHSTGRGRAKVFYSMTTLSLIFAWPVEKYFGALKW